jgi:hypothetical protein
MGMQKKKERFDFEASIPSIFSKECERKQNLKLIYFGSLKAGCFFFCPGAFGFLTKMEKQQTWTGARVITLL